MVKKIILEPAFVLHRRPYKETSLIVNFFTKNKGKITAVAKGAKRPKSPLRLIQTPGALLSISLSGKGSLLNINNCEISHLFSLNYSSLSCLVYLNELLSKFLEIEDPHEEIFLQYLSVCEILEQSSQEEIEKKLREFELILLSEVGYGINLETDSITNTPIDEKKKYSFSPSSGFKETSSPKGIIGSDIVNFSKGDFSLIDTRRTAKNIMREAIDFHLGNKNLNLRQFLKKRGG